MYVLMKWGESMALTANERLASYILQGPHTHREWTEFQRTLPHLMIKEVSSETVLICTDGKGWFKPMDWLGNYQNQMIQRYLAEKRRLRVILPDPRFREVVFGEEEQARLADVKQNWFESIDYYLSYEDWTPMKRLMSLIQAELTRATDSETAKAVVNRIREVLPKYPYKKP